jgi:hypothetical protein
MKSPISAGFEIVLLVPVQTVWPLPSSAGAAAGSLTATLWGAHHPLGRRRRAVSAEICPRTVPFPPTQTVCDTSYNYLMVVSHTGTLLIFAVHSYIDSSNTGISHFMTNESVHLCPCCRQQGKRASYQYISQHRLIPTAIGIDMASRLHCYNTTRGLTLNRSACHTSMTWQPSQHKIDTKHNLNLWITIPVILKLMKAYQGWCGTTCEIENFSRKNENWPQIHEFSGSLRESRCDIRQSFQSRLRVE